MRILSAELLTDDIAATADFYAVTLGLPVHWSDTETLAIGAGASRLLFRKSVNKKPVYHFAFNVPQNQIEEALGYYDARVDVIPFEGELIVDFKAWNAHSFYFTDNNGNVLELIARHDLDNSSGAPFRPFSISCISEVAVCVGNVTDVCEIFKEETGIGHYEKQPPHHKFAAMGNAEGLLIVSARGRHWFPTQTLAAAFPVTIKFADGDRVRSMHFDGDLRTAQSSR